MPPRAMWKGSVTFGLVHIPVRMTTAVRDQTIRFHRLSEDGKSRIRTKLFNPDTGDEVDYTQTSRGYEIAPDTYVVVEDEEIETLLPEAGHTIDIEDFVGLSEIDPIYYDRPYYLLPGEGGARPYRLLVAAMEKADRVGIARFVLREKQHLAAVRVSQGGLCLSLMNWHDEVVALKDAGEIPDEKADPKQVALALNLIDQLTRPFDPSRYEDSFRGELMALIKRKAKGEEIEIAPSRPADEKVVDLMEALKKSLADKGKATKKVTAKSSRAKKTA